MLVLKSDPTRYWTVREIWDEEVRRNWAEPTKDALAAVRVALRRLRDREGQVQVLNGPTYAYRWVAGSRTEVLAATNGS